MRQYVYFIIVALSLFACKNDNDQSDYAYLGGEIINPNNNFIVLSRADQVIDTISLDSHNRFVYKLKNLNPGMYTFRHGSEVQTVFLEPLDSIMFRLNTFDFDESLVYTGEGAKKNNYLINEFLQNEIDEHKIFKLCQLNPEAFEKQIDSIKNNKTEKLNRFKNKYKTSPLFNKIAQSNIDYSYYSSKEIYPFVNYNSNKRNLLKSLPKDFYSYRKNIEYNNELYNTSYLNYNSFLRSSFNNIALEKHLNHSKEDCFNNTSLCYNLDKLNIVDSLVVNTSIKNELLYYFTISFLTKNKNIDNDNAILKSFLNKSTDDKNKEIITNLVHSLNNLKPGGTFPNIDLVNTENGELKIKSVISKPTVIYFWSNKFYDHFKKTHHKASELKIKYPEMHFIAINIDDINLNSWRNTLKRNNFSLRNEYQFEKPEESMNILAVYPITKVFIIDKDNSIVNSNTNMFASNFEEQLLGLLNR
ncbi:hypothetical protein [Yeosuana marina]|uniref:TlpA family protein disulfide reductase n=1 Tax=Yeosuana marina TaxID=1565536 RepID=UPI0030ECA88B|tara:strand:+ start:435 stop:1853 length:1419 start_codon:yes stop_codon:yes gene_type:complete